jgi:hypothetical protein
MASFTKIVSQIVKGLSVPQWILLAVFIFYFIFPITFPRPVYLALESIPGIILVFCVIVYLFIYSHPVLGIFALLAAYEFFYHSSIASSYSPSTSKTAFLEYTPPEVVKTAEIQQTLEVAQSLPVTAPNVPMTLEEEVVQQMAPVGQSDTSVYVNTRFQPVADSVGTASMYQ